MNNNENHSAPLVTIAVITYNSAEFVVETLESVKRQTYQNIELVVSDDGSKDDSVAVCKDWIEHNGSRFVRTELIAGENIGVAGNSNRALSAAHGEWFKDLAGDDILPDDAVEKHMRYIEAHPNVEFFFGKEIYFYGDFKDANFKPQRMPFRYVFFGDRVTARRQFRLLTRLFFGAPTASFGKASAIREVGGYNEAIPMAEDGPLYIALAKAGKRLGFMDEYSVYKRIHSQSRSHVSDPDAIIPVYDVWDFENYSFWNLQAENSGPFWKLMYRFSTMLWRKVIESGNNRHSFKCRFYDFLRRYLNPYKHNMIILYLEEYICRLLHGDLKTTKNN